MQTLLNFNLSNGVKTFRNNPLIFLFLVMWAFSSCVKHDHHSNECEEFKDDKHSAHDGNAPSVSVFATGFNNPRGLKFGPDCHLYVAEAGLGGTNSTVEICPDLQIGPAGGGPFMGSPTGGRISRVDATGERTTVTENLPSSISNFGDILGVADIAFIGDKLYALLVAGCSRGVPEVPASIARINYDGTHTVIADLGAWHVSNPVENPGEDFDPEGNPYSMITVNGKFYVVEANQGQMLKVRTDGTINRVVDISAKYNHIVPTVIAIHDGNFYVGNLGPFPAVEGSSNVYRISPSGETEIAETGFTMILGLAFDKKGRLYVLENTTGNPFPTPGTGRIVRVNHDGSRDVIVTGLNLPTGMTYGPDGNLYVSQWGFGAPAGGGEIVKVSL